MKLVHLSDLHLGKRVNEFSMLEDQEDILEKIMDICADEQPEGVLIAGDVYDKPVPPAEAVELFDDFLVRLSQRGLQVFVIAGNHDSPERIAFGGRLMENSGVHLAPVYDGHVEPLVLEDGRGPVHIYLLPFVKPANVRRAFPEAGVETYTDALRTAVEQMGIDPGQRNILVTHQFVTGARRSESEEIAVGGSDNVDAAVFAAFDYVALGHLHSPQKCTEEKIRYCGTPLKYSFSEAKDQKSVTIVELGAKGELTVRTRPLTPRRDMKEIRGTYAALTLKSFYENTTYPEDYMHITLTDEEDIPDAIGKLRAVYHNLMRLDYDNTRTRAHTPITGGAAVEKKPPAALFADFYEMQNNQPMSREQAAFVKELIECVWEAKE